MAGRHLPERGAGPICQGKPDSPEQVRFPTAQPPGSPFFYLLFISSSSHQQNSLLDRIRSGYFRTLFGNNGGLKQIPLRTYGLEKRLHISLQESCTHVPIPRQPWVCRMQPQGSILFSTRVKVEPFPAASGRPVRGIRFSHSPKPAPTGEARRRDLTRSSATRNPLARRASEGLTGSPRKLPRRANVKFEFLPWKNTSWSCPRLSFIKRDSSRD